MSFIEFIGHGRLLGIGKAPPLPLIPLHRQLSGQSLTLGLLDLFHRICLGNPPAG